MNKPVLIVAGPTASGKSSLAVTIAEAFDGVVVNADSMQVYRELQVLTARPGSAVLARAPHRLYGVLSVREPGSAGLWREMAMIEIAAAHKRGRLPIVTGGTGLYLRALVEGLVDLPKIPKAVRDAARSLYNRLGPEGFHAALAERDPLAARRLRPTDRQRLIRAWEVYEVTGRSLMLWQAAATEGPPTDLRFGAVLLDPPRAELYATIDRRLDAMLAGGALEEVRTLLAMDLDPHLSALRAVGMSELARHLKGELSREEAIALTKQATRRFAKRQLTWFRHQPLGSKVLVVREPLDAQFSESLRARIFNFIRQFLLT